MNDLFRFKLLLQPSLLLTVKVTFSPCSLLATAQLARNFEIVFLCPSFVINSILKFQLSFLVPLFVSWSVTERQYGLQHLVLTIGIVIALLLRPIKLTKDKIA